MNNEKTGKLISQARQQKNMTQQEVAEKLHITSKAVSKWERGLSFPSVDLLEKLANILDISVVDILAGEIVPAQNVIARTNEVSLRVLKKERKTKRGLVLAAAGLMGFLLLLILGCYRNVIFQRGDPIPYLLAAMSIGDEAPYVEVGDNTGIYISKRGECPELFEFIEESKNVEFAEQLGSGYRFTNGLDSLAVTSEIYWKYFTVWEVPRHTLQAK